MPRHSQPQPSPPGLLEALRRSWWVILTTVALGGVLAFAYLRGAERTYEATASVLIVTPAPATAQELAPTYLEFVKSEPVLGAVIRELGLSQTSEELAAKVQATVEGRSNVIEVRVRDESRPGSARIADTIVRELAREAPRPGDDESATAEVRLEPLDSAGEFGVRVKPDASFSLAAGLFAGLLVGLALALRPRLPKRRRPAPPAEPPPGPA
jgi:polysaccharide biosynthesis transport protein